jgi:membrane-bound lytic murein transglycosylase B
VIRVRDTARLLFALLALAASCAAAGAAPALRPEVEAFVREFAARHGHDTRELRKLLQKAQTRHSIIRAMSAPGTARPWYEYRERIVEPRRIENGVRFWQENAIALERASREFGVPEELIVATIGIETLYGRNMGSFRVIDALSTLAFDYPPRAEFFRGELEEYLLLVREAGIDAYGTRGSYAGAIGIPQFLPSSYRKYAIDFDGDGRRDLVKSTADAIGSVASYYRSFGWQTGAPVVIAAESGKAELAPLLAAGIRPHTKVGELRNRGLIVQETVDENAEATVFFVQEESGPRLLLGLNNFYVITRYNRSTNYAMAVHDLAREIRAAMGAR